MPFEDKTIVCADCGREFVHSAQDQSRYAERGFNNEPKRCKECRDKRKAQGGGQGGGGGYRTAGAGPSTRPQRFGNSDRPMRESHEAVCAECGATTTVPFKPTQGRPVYCRDCFQSRRR